MAKDDEPARWRNHYRCPVCRHEWADEWSCQCDDDCPACGLRHISPVSSDDLLEDPVEDDGSGLVNSGALDVSVAGPARPGTAGVSGADCPGDDEGTIEHGEWACIFEPEEDSDGFYTDGWHAQHKVTGKTRIIHHSRFDFTMTPARFRWLVDNDFPLRPGKGNWTNAAIDAAMEDGA